MMEDLSSFPANNKKKVGPSGAIGKREDKLFCRKEIEQSGAEDLQKERKQRHAALIDEYACAEKRKGLSEQGWRSMRKRIPKLFCYLDEMGLELTEVCFLEAQNYQKWLIENGRNDGKPYASGSVLNYLKAAKRFYAFLQDRGQVLDNPFSHIRLIRYEKPLPSHVLKENQMHQLLGMLSQKFLEQKDLYKQLRWYKCHVIAELQYSTGMRISEVADLQEQDIDWEKSRITIKRGKGGLSRIVFLNEYARDVLKLFVEIRSRLLKNNSQASIKFFGAGSPRLMFIVNTTLKEACEELDLPSVTSHGFRHAFGFHLLRSGCDLRYIQNLLGHRRLSTTEIYTKVDREDLRDMLDAYHPRQKRDV